MFHIRSNKKKMTRAERHQRRQRLMYISVAALTAACIGGIALMSIFNCEPTGSRYTYTTESDIWYVDNGSMEVAAVQAVPTIDTAIKQEAAMLFIQEPEIFLTTQEPTLEPTPDPTPQPTDEMLIAQDIAR